MARHPLRRDLHENFNEGARMLWERVAAAGGSQAAVAAAIGCDPGVLSRWLYGDTRPGLRWAGKAQDVLSIPTTAWHKPPSQPFEPPASRAARDDNEIADDAPSYASPAGAVSTGPTVATDAAQESTDVRGAA